MVHTLRLDNYSPTPRKLVLGTNSSFGTESIKIERGAGWDGLNLTATWHIPGREEPLRVALLDGDAMDVPPEVTKEAKDGVLVLAGLASGVQRASCNVEYLILEQAGVYGGADAEPTPELAAQVLEAALQAKADAEAAAEDAAAAKANADKAQADAEKAQQAAENAAADAAKAGPYAEAARAAKEAAESARDEAIAAQQAAENAAAAAAASKSAADTLATEAARAAKAAEDSKAAANNAASFAGKNATAAQQAAGTATAAANDAGQSASDAAASKAAAKTAAKAAQDAQTAAAAAKADAVKAQTTAQTAAKSAQDAQAAAEKARDDAKTAQKGAEAARDTAAKSAEAAAKSEANAKQSADTLAESVENVVANTAAVAELKQQVKNITPDDSSIGEKPWSSKHIIDMLCPPLEESGNPVVCYPVAGYPLGVKASWEPAQEGSGTPSPENIRPIKGRDSVKVERCGENLLKFPYATSSANRNGLVITSQQDGSITVNGTATADTWYAINLNIEKRLPVNTPMALSGCPAGGSTKSYYIGLYLGGKWFSDSGNGNTDVKFTTREAASRVEVSIIKGTVCNNLTFYPKIEVGTTSTPYSKYQSQTNTLTLPETVYGGEVDARTGEGESQYNKASIQIEKLNYNQTISAMLGFASSNILNNIQLPPSNQAIFDGVCDCLPINSASKINAGAIGFGISASGDIYLRAEGLYSKEAYAAKFPDGVNVCYKVATPTSFSAAGNASVKALSGVNTVLTDADSATVTGRADPIKRITDLEDAVASQT